MNKKAILALMLAALIPLISYLVVKYYGSDAVKMPHRFFFDSVAVVEKRGKATSDTLWHSVKNIAFTNQLGDKVSLDDLKGKIIVASFFFTRCPSLCPQMARSMKKLQKSFKKNDNIVQLLQRLY